MKVKVRFKSLLLLLLTAVMLPAAASNVLPGSFSTCAAEKENSKRPTVLLILDGFGLNERSEHNAIALADTPVLDRLMKE